MNYTSSEAARTVKQFRTGGRRSGRFGKMKPKPRLNLKSKWSLNLKLRQSLSLIM
jgi:hypothetical protein